VYIPSKRERELASRLRGDAREAEDGEREGEAERKRVLREDT